MHTPNRDLPCQRAHERGAGMVELMVAVVVGLLVALAAMGTAQTTGAVIRSQEAQGSAVGSAVAALGALRYDLQMGGLGFFSDATPQCASLNLYSANTTVSAGSVFQAVRIDRMPDGTDRVDVVYAGDVTSGAASRTVSPMTRPMGPVLLDAGARITAGQAVLVSSSLTGMPCTVATVGTAASASGGRMELRFDTPGGHTPANWTTAFPALGLYPDSSSVALLGQLVWRRYAVRNDALIMTDVLTGTEVTIAEGVVLVRAQYGLAVDAAAAGIDAWRDATAQAPLSTQDMARLRAVRIGVVAVSADRERAVQGVCQTTTAAPVLWDGETPDLSGRPDWGCFRYRAYATVVGLRNLQWGQRL